MTSKSTAKKTAAPQQQPEPSAQSETDRRLKKAYTTAMSQLRAKYRDEFEQLQVEAARDLGVEYKPRPKPEDKARATLEELRVNHPALFEEYLRQQQEASADPEEPEE